MVDPNPHHDPADPRGAANHTPDHSSSGPDDYIDYPDSDPEYEHHETSAEERVGFEPDGRHERSMLDRDRKEASALHFAALNADPDEWTFDRVIFALVEAATERIAIAKGTAAFKQRHTARNAPDVPDSALPFRMISEFSDEPSRTLTKLWGGVFPDAVREDSERGQHLCELIRERTLDEQGAYLFTESGHRITDDFGLETLDRESDDQRWLVPAIRCYREEDLDDTDAAEEIDALPISKKRTRFLCHGCGPDTTHRFVETTRIPELDMQLAFRWTCTTCGNVTGGPDPREVAHRSRRDRRF